MARQTFVLQPQEDAAPVDPSVDGETTELLTTTEGSLLIEEKEAPESATEVAVTVTESAGTDGEAPVTTVSTAAEASSTSSTTLASVSSTTSTTVSSTTRSTTSAPSTTSSTTPSSAASIVVTADPPIVTDTPLVTDAPLNEVEKEEDDITDILKLLETTFEAYEPSSNHFDSIPSMEDITLSCDVIIAAGTSASSISASDIASMSSKESRTAWTPWVIFPGHKPSLCLSGTL
eukprot:TRINITY_DN14874_c0_g1_i1.p1 TRINITY_DN14874_c0_g1~~TRINITY_DN14874_c0_g1_i1.p1  ORF type:complete len:255 (+),score=45.83 TRINITY_DN14874_c0_g1_i1:68-766(+)